MPSDSDAIRAIAEEYASAVSSDDLDRLIAIFTDDAHFLTPDAPELVGTDAIRSWVKEKNFDPFVVQEQIAVTHLDMTDSWAYGRGTFAASVTPRGGGDELSGVGKWIGSFAKQSDGGWKWASLIFNWDAPLGS